MAWRRAAGGYAAWVGVHAVAGAAFAQVVLAMRPDWQTLWVAGLVAGVLFGAGQWVVLEWLCGGMRWWVVATVLASPVSWIAAQWIGMITLVLGGWLGAIISAGAQAVVLAVRFRTDSRALWFGLTWVVAALIGGAVFYFCYLNSSFALIVVGSVGYACVTGLVVAVLPQRERGGSQSHLR